MQTETKLDKLFRSAERFCSHTSWMHWVYPAMVGSGILAMLQRIRYKKAGKSEEFMLFCQQHETQLEELRYILADDMSRRTLDGLLAYRKTNDIQNLKDLVVQPQYFQKDILSPDANEVFVDGGAFIGDTIEAFLKNFSGDYRKIYAWEPDSDNLNFLKKKYGSTKYHDVVICPYGMWDGHTKLCFDQQGTSNSMVMENDMTAGSYIETESIDRLCGNDKVTFIKMDIEGSELRALYGASEVIRRDRPKLAICIYHKPEDLFEIPFYVKDLVPEYKIYIRQHHKSWTETVMYACI